MDECDAFEDFGELSDVFGSFGAAAKQVLWEPSLHFPVDEPEAHGSSCPLQEYSASSTAWLAALPGAVSFRRAIAAIYIHVLLLTSTKASPPPRPVASLWSTQDRVLAGVRFPED